jgi:hypothetical protein
MCLSFILKFSSWNGFSSNLSAHHSTLLACDTVEAKQNLLNRVYQHSY